MILPKHANNGQILKPFPKDDNSLIYVHARMSYTICNCDIKKIVNRI